MGFDRHGQMVLIDRVHVGFDRQGLHGGFDRQGLHGGFDRHCQSAF
jgi:hypothetical protein